MPRKPVRVTTLPWKRTLAGPPSPSGPHVIRRLMKEGKWNPKLRKFDLYRRNENIDIYTKRSALKASPSVISVECYSGHVPVLQFSGCVIESNSKYSIILTTAKLCKCSMDDTKIMVHLADGRSYKGKIKAYDFYFDIAAIRIRPNISLPVASLALVNDSISVDPSCLHFMEEESSQLSPQSTTSCDLIPGEVVIALGRFPRRPYPIMAAPGLFSINLHDYDCKEFFTASCRTTSCGVGGPLINQEGDVIGICLRDGVSIGFLPINVASLWWKHHKKSGQTRRLCLGMVVANFYAAQLDALEIIIQKFPDVLEGVLVEEVVRGSSAAAAGIKTG